MKMFRMRDALVIGAVSLGCAAMSFAVVNRNRETANRIRCARNLQQLGLAIALYANENRGAYPRTTYELDAAPVWGTPYADDITEAKPNVNCDPFADEKKAPADVLALKPKGNDVTAAMYLLLRTQDIVPEVFICPSTKLKRYDFGGKGEGALSFTNFPGKEALARHLSYSYQNPYPTKEAVMAGFKLNNSLTAEFAVMADMNPGTEELKTIRATAPYVEMRKVNSRNHDGHGQNILFGDGHVEFYQNPFAGVVRDNIYLANDPPADPRRPQNYRKGEPAIVASSADANDSILLPTAADLGQDVNYHDPVTPAADVAALEKQILGTFANRSADGRPVVLTIDAGELKAVTGPMTIAYRYKVLGTRGKAIVLELIAPETPTIQVDLRLSSPGSIYIDASDDFADVLAGGWARRAQ